MCVGKNSRLPYSERRATCDGSVGPWVSCQGVSGTRGHRAGRDCVSAQDMSPGGALCLKGLPRRQSPWAAARHHRLSLTWSKAKDASPGAVSYWACWVSGRHDGKSGLRVVLTTLGSWLSNWPMVWCVVQAVVITGFISNWEPGSCLRALTLGAAFWSMKGWWVRGKM